MHLGELPSVRITELRRSGTITPDMACIAVTIEGNDGALVSTEVGVVHFRMRSGGVFLQFICRRCGRRAQVLRLQEAADTLGVPSRDFRFLVRTTPVLTAVVDEVNEIFCDKAEAILREALESEHELRRDFASRFVLSGKGAMRGWTRPSGPAVTIEQARSSYDLTRRFQSLPHVSAKHPLCKVHGDILATRRDFSCRVPRHRRHPISALRATSIRPLKCRRTTPSDRRRDAVSWARRSIKRPGRRETEPPWKRVALRRSTLCWARRTAGLPSHQ
jgi:hypothetical protein